MRKLAPVLVSLALAAGCEAPPADPIVTSAAPALLPYRGDALVVRLVTEAAARHEVPRDVLLALGWAETRLVSRTGMLAHEGEEAHGDPTACGVFGLDEGTARDEAARLVDADAASLCEHLELEVDAAAARLRALAGDAPPAQDDTAAWLALLDAWHPALADVRFPYREHLAQVMDIGFRDTDERGDVIYLPPIDGLVSPIATNEDGVGVAIEYARPDTPLAEWQGPACDYTNASRGRGDIRYVVIHTCEGGFAGCVNTVRSCGGSQVSAHYVTSYTGFTAQIVEEQDTAWHVGCLNGSSIGIEHEGFAGSTNHPDAQLCRTARIVRSICDRYGIPCDRSRVIGHVEANSMFCHGDHWDPGPHWDWAKFMRFVNEGCDCRPTAESCNGRDDDCDRRTDEGVTNACGTCGGTPAETCNGRDDDCDGTVDEDDVCEVALLLEQPSAYAPPSSTDVNGDGRADVCGRGYSGVRCWLAQEGAWGAATAAVPWGDMGGWDDVANHATLRMGDVNGDGRADVCARANAGVVCALSSGTGFDAHTTWSDVPSDASGWGAPRFYTTMRLADVNGDGREDLCARASAGFGCWLSDGTRFGERIEGPEWSDASGFGVARHYGTIRMGDVNGDGRDDACVRAAAGLDCWLSDGAGFPTRVEGPRWADAVGWGDRRYWSTIRLADVNGDGRDDVCARSASDLRCVLASDEGFGETRIVAPLADASGWDDVSNYATIVVGDVNGDRVEDLCARSNAELACYAWDGEAFARIAGPAWADESGWSAARYYQTIRMADVDGDGRDDACARAAAGWRCHPSSGDGFGEAIALDDMTDAGGWDAPRYFTTILAAGRACRAMDETCNGRDDDCDGEVDEHASAEICNEVDDDCDGEIDEMRVCEMPDAGGIEPGRDAGPRGDGGAMPSIDGGCSCRVASGPGHGAWWALGLVLAAIVARRRR
ncbi:N-acetylmuramoyl-L-alanine amidase [Sandaracinus amylolyticus]|uniref:N-acetylmuramoyl-L-alanine amidase n=1 Tax=Sandaracinus amylolyticus TaxID=927083 RepID=A0A0F6YKD3_9BACT|nr:N-acetylmuramoyl-L-alanine amidase [Sandaracinus amylolyticus]AKF08741.1 N-acetylmuramoyl-L-alanine amidase [Sandaracinus amylolyticus]